MKKWKFEDEMSFLLPFMQERDTYNNLKDVSDDDNEDEPNEDEYDDDRNNEREDDRNNDRRDDRNDDKDDDKDDNVDEELHTEDEKKRKQKEINRKIITKAKNKENKENKTQPETASAVMMKYLLEKKTAKAQITPPTSTICNRHVLYKYCSNGKEFFSLLSKYSQITNILHHH